MEVKTNPRVQQSQSDIANHYAKVNHCAKMIELLQRNLIEGADQVGSGTATDTNACPLDWSHTACAHGANRTHLIMMKQASIK